MTNKLPVVGKRYRLCVGINDLDRVEYQFCEVKRLTDTAVECLVDGLQLHYYPKDTFLLAWEELPEDKAETKPETQSHISESKEKMKQALDVIRNRKKYLEGYNNGFDDCLKEMAERFPDQISETSLIPSNSRELSPEVKEAMEKLKDDIKAWVDDVFGDFTPLSRIKPLEPGPVYETLMMINDLLNALDKQFMSKEGDKIDTSSEVCLSNNEMKPNENGSFKHLDNAEEISQDIMKEESIWKPVSELPEDGIEKLLIKLDGSVQIANHTFFDDEQIDEVYIVDGWKDNRIECTSYPAEDIKEFCTLTDFINDYEKLKERDKLKEIKLRELEERVKKLEEK